LSGSGDHATAVSLYSAIVTGLYRRERTGKGSYVTTSLLAGGIWACGVSIQAALCDAKFYPLHDRRNPPNATFNVYRASDDNWFLIVLTPDKWPALASGIGRPDLLTDARFTEPAKLVANAAAPEEGVRKRLAGHFHLKEASKSPGDGPRSLSDTEIPDRTTSIRKERMFHVSVSIMPVRLRAYRRKKY
jgi:crotonobetainyl-CoA:carnitine CoA-transferase CaiB-like acyl-CoA transferase